MQEFEQGWQFVPSEHSACPACAKGEPAVVDFIVAAGSPGVCTYCSKRRRHTVATNDLLEFLFEGVASEYGQADAEGLPVAEGSYIFEPTDGDELLFWELGLDVTNASLREAIESATRESQWCNRDPLAPAPHQQSIFSWQRFSAAVKHDVRFLFKEHAPPADWYEQLDAPVGPGEILEHVGNLLSEIPSSFGTLEAGESVYRARWSASPEGYSKARDLTAPPPPKATIANRMSPPGISYFYGSLDEATALIETVGRTREERRRRRYGTVARWILTRSVPVLDLTADLELPSIFDPAHRGRRNAIRFVTAFRDEVSAQINPGTAAYELRSDADPYRVRPPRPYDASRRASRRHDVRERTNGTWCERGSLYRPGGMRIPAQASITSAACAPRPPQH